jgi:hypothetical protein
MSEQYAFNPLDYGFRWTDDGWYTFDNKNAHHAAMSARNAAAKRARAQGRKVRCSTSSNQLMSKGGIGSGFPHIELIVNVYRMDVE